jgi:hypothetical protein
MTPPPSGPRRSGRRLWLVLGAAALVLVIVGGAATVVLWPKSTSAPQAAGPPLAEASAATGAPVATTAPPLSSTTYHGVTNLCATVDLTPLTELYPKQLRANPSGTTANMACHTDLQSDTVAGLLSVEARLLPDAASVRVMYEGLRKATLRTDVVIEIPGLGTGAYWHLEQALGTEVVAYDGNLYITALWGDLHNPAKTAPDIVMRLTTLVRNTMTKLKA